MREDNGRADELANLAMDRRADVVLVDAAEGPPSGGAAAAAPRHAAERDDPAAPPKNRKASTQAGPDDGGADDRRPTARSVRVTCQKAPQPGACPAGDWPSQALILREHLPAGVCLHAAHALLPTVLAIQNADPDEFHAVPVLTVRCGRAGCQAVFQVAPHVAGNGRH
jgi:uncharacterized repeat protein (TIGR04076 family)